MTSISTVPVEHQTSTAFVWVHWGLSLLSMIPCSRSNWVRWVVRWWVKKNESLTTVNLSYNGLSDDGAAALARCVRLNKTIRHLDVSNNRISAIGARVFAAGLKKNDCLEVLRVRLDSTSFCGRLLAICRSSGCTVASGVVGICNRSQMRTSKCTCLIFGVRIVLDPS